MHRVLAALILIAALALVALPADSAQAGGPGCYGGFGGAYAYNPHAYGNGWWPYTLGYVPVPPYFALHPPVYYSYPVARPYGASPYPYTPMQEPVYAVEAPPQEIINPYVTCVERDSGQEPSTDHVISYGQVVINPYVEQGDAPRLAEAK